MVINMENWPNFLSFWVKKKLESHFINFYFSINIYHPTTASRLFTVFKCRTNYGGIESIDDFNVSNFIEFIDDFNEIGSG